MTTLAVMKQRIADEVARSDLTGMIAYAISDAIKYYQSKRFFFNEQRELEFDTADGQDFYDKNDNSLIPGIMEFDWVVLDLDGWAYHLCYSEPQIMDESVVVSSGQPTSYTYYQQQIRLYPTPNDTWTIRVAGHILLPEPSSDTERYNAWMTDAERLIRSRAKLNLVRNVNAAGLLPTFSNDAISIYAAEENDAFRELKQRTNKVTTTGKVKGYY